MEDWRKRGVCANDNPHLWDVDYLPPATSEAAKRERARIARDRCAGCTVFRECAEDAVRPMRSVDGFPLHTTGVIRAGVIT
ncbi:WhiB family transcriptional regulator [Nocardia transvalensis]|uniref:WhiB family transcriptional regulator n=1 Tax=Nocardia transvalensis TaxID=37333 RepID=UPI003A5D1655